MRKYIILFILMTFMGCKNDAVKENSQLPKNDKADKSIRGIIDYFPTVPYAIKNKPKFIIPDSLGGAELDGFVVLNVEFDSLDNIKNFEIEKLRTQHDDKPIIEYIRPDKKTDVIKQYERLCRIYLQKIKFEKISQSETKNESRIRLLLRFNQ